MTDFSLEFVFASGEKHSPKAEPNEWLLRSDADTVADSLTVRFGVGKRLFTEEPVGAVLKKDGAVIFDGIVDEHRVKCQNGARTEAFSLRSRAALYGIRGTAFSRRLTELTDLLELGVIDGIIPEPEGGAHLAQNASWWQGKSLPLERIELTACKNTDSMAYAFYTHDIQMLVCDLTGTNTSNVYGSGSYTDIPTSVMQYIGFNVTRAPFNDPKLRAALSLGMDRAGGVSAFLLGHGQTAQFPLSPSAVVYPKDLEETYSPDSYRSAMETAGYTSGEKSVSVTMLVNEENSFKVSMARKLASDLSQYDVKIDVKALPYEDYLAALKAGDFDLYYGECKLTADWDLSPLLSPGGALNYGGVRDTQLETLLTAFRTASEGEGRQTAARELCSYLKEQAPLVAVCFKSNSVLLPEGAVKNDIHPTVSDPFADFQDWQLNMKS